MNAINNSIIEGAHSHKIPAKTDVSYLGVLIGEQKSDRIIAVSTTSVFEDSSLVQTFWGVEYGSIDSGFQGHIYTRPNDILVVRVPGNDDKIPQMVMTAIRANYEIWKSLTGIELSSDKSRILLASDSKYQSKYSLPDNIEWHIGTLIDAATTRYRKTGEAFLAFVLNKQVAEMLKLRRQRNITLMDQAHLNSLLMNKNDAMQLLQKNNVTSAKTYSFNETTSLKQIETSVPSEGLYVFKPAGGAAGIGLFNNNGVGASRDSIILHLDSLIRKHQLPHRFQIQEFIPGTPYGLTAFFSKKRTFEIFEIHQQIINDAGRFAGAKWKPAIQDEHVGYANSICSQLANIEQPSISGLICLDIINHKVIEVNPRLTASAPIVHILQRQKQIAAYHNIHFEIEQIDLNTNLRIPYDSIQNGKLSHLIEKIWKENGVLILPQGLNPFGASRFLFINDNSHCTFQQYFVKQIKL